jgi:hypothetical protein
MVIGREMALVRDFGPASRDALGKFCQNWIPKPREDRDWLRLMREWGSLVIGADVHESMALWHLGVEQWLRLS